MLAVIVVAMLSGVSADPKQSDWDWLTEHRTAAFEALMPVTFAKAPLVTYRSYRDLYQDVPERYFSIEQGQALKAVVVVPNEVSIQQQLLNLHMAEPGASLESLLVRVRVNRVVLEASTCPAIQKQLNRLRRLRFTVPDMDMIILHPEVHHVVVDASGGTVDAVLQQDDHPLVKWCLETLMEIQRCPAVRGSTLGARAGEQRALQLTSGASRIDAAERERSPGPVCERRVRPCDRRVGRCSADLGQACHTR